MHMHLANAVHAFTMHAHAHGTERMHAVEIEVAPRCTLHVPRRREKPRGGIWLSGWRCGFRASNLRSRSGTVLVRNDAFGYRWVVFARSIGGTVPGSLLYAKICAYHADCWQTHGRGGTYTCGRCLRARIAHTSTESRCWVLCQQGSFTTTTAMTGRRMSRVRYVCDGGCAVRN